MAAKLNSSISPETAGTLVGLFQERVRRTPNAVAYRHFDPKQRSWQETTWAEMATEVTRWQAALSKEELNPGDRVALMLRNSREWVFFEQAALGLELVVVPLYINDRPDNVRYILKNAEVKLLMIEGYHQWQEIKQWWALRKLVRVISLNPFDDEARGQKRLCYLQEWLPKTADKHYPKLNNPDALATIVYTSGTTGLPKGVMLSHHNILWNAHSSLQSTPIYEDDLFLSFLPLSHSLERTLGYYLPMMAGAQVAYTRSIAKLAEDLVTIKPTVLVSVPRIFERVHNQIYDKLREKTLLERALFKLAIAAGWRQFNYQQGRAPWHPLCLLNPLLRQIVGRQVLAQFGGRLRIVVCGGAPLVFNVARELLALGLPLIQGYGLTEASPVISGNSLNNNDPKSVGTPLQDVEIRIGEHNELLGRSPGVMLGYWNNPKATAEVIDEEGWLHTGDQARIEQGRLYITGRIKEIIVLATGEKVPPGEMETAIGTDPLFDQAMVVGEGKPYLSALIVVNPEHWNTLAQELNLDPHQKQSLEHPAVLEEVLERIEQHTRQFPGYARIRRAALTQERWTTENGLATATLKARRKQVIKHYRNQISALYEGH
ncbi:AMP-dependent synthetase and ligase [Nitrosococcus oceani ATCC 19707]|uniref:AMP-dependent synthetase and ligase n=2 Tax=Nitrosococcus oceani TaxID=1229 RepID=Q3JCV8_NITOC|nr:long-chain fatty acid--CoA ligase [Nitrosococcus oceani]ABA57338.1 AMP-dependent synthetase and ligase [Nitrosococcus oceani ATCC 19707]EDZ68115.1 AMP-binding enzyme, putative [Nitrosococcus oceani AFC27]KFI20314.1 AMP-dependent synthetase [Nitrosococcus oceani C-27]GEM20212.1 AMP-dependent synthetase [Nitrosococcus oceani]